MLREARERFPDAAGGVLAEASAVLGADVAAWARAAAGVPLERNHDVQVGLFLTNHIHLLGIESAGVAARWSAGLSLGELNHLVHIGALSFAHALSVVSQRGRCYDAAPEGMLAAVFPLELEELEPAVQADPGVVAIALSNSPTQHVIAGEPGAVRRVIARLEEDFFVEVRELSTPIAPHTPLFEEAAARLRPVLDGAPWRRPLLPYVPNATGQICADPAPRAFPSLLQRQVCETVRWRRTIETLAAACPDGAFVEVGPGQTLTGLLRRGWIQRPRFCTDDAASMRSAVEMFRDVG